MEFLIGRILEDAAINLGLKGIAEAALVDLGQDFDTIAHDEPDAALGNGGLGRLAACYMESMATSAARATATASATSTGCSASASRWASRWKRRKTG